MISRWVLLAFGPALLLPARSASAAPEERCGYAYNEAQDLRSDVTKLTKARDRLRLCASEDCPTVLRDECRKDLADVEARMPSVLLVAEAEDGSKVVDVKVWRDDRLLVTELDGKSIAMDGGTHLFAFQREGFAPLEITVVLRASEKNVPVVVRFGARLAPAPPKILAPVAPEEVLHEPPATEQAPSPSVLPTVALVIAGVGGVGLGLGMVFGISAATQQSNAGCTDNVCPDEEHRTKLEGAQSAGNLSTLFLAGGAVFVATGITLFVLAPRGTSIGPTARLRPVLTPTAAAVVFEGLVF